jgi:hypothetical protein
MKIQDACPTCGALCDVDLGAEESEYVAIEQAATRDDMEARFIAKHGHRLATLFLIDAFDLADRDAQIMAVLAATRDAPSADAVDAQRWRYMTTHNATCSVEHMEQLIDGLMAENAARIATSAPKEST